MRCILRSILATIALGFGACAASAHPHVFIDTALTFHIDDQGRLEEVSVVWSYDALTSLLMIEDLGLDPDGSGVLTVEEKARLDRLETEWSEEFDGDLHLSRNGRGFALSRPQGARAEYREGRIITTYTRTLPEQPDMSAGAVSVQIYDPSYYIFYDLIALPQISGGANCTVHIVKADRTAAQRLYDTELAKLTEEELMLDGKYPDVGGAFADEVRLECASQP